MSSCIKYNINNFFFKFINVPTYVLEINFNTGVMSQIVYND